MPTRFRDRVSPATGMVTHKMVAVRRNYVAASLTHHHLSVPSLFPLGGRAV